MKILIIGGTGHMGTFLTPKFTAAGHEVYLATRGNTKIRDEEAFRGANFITCDAKNIDSIRALKAYDFDTVIDFPGTAYTVWQELKNSISHLIACGSLWMFGYPRVVPTPEIPQGEIMHPAHVQRFAEIEKMMEESGKFKAVFSAVMPPNVCGPGKIPLDQLGRRSIENHKAMAKGEVVYLPTGPEVTISPCDADDLATLFFLVAENRDKAAGELFNAGAASSVTISEFINIYSKIYGVKLPIEKVSWEKYTTEINPNKGDWWHFYSHMCPDISKAKRLLGYEPKYTTEQTMRRAVEWMKKEGMLD